MKLIIPNRRVRLTTQVPEAPYDASGEIAQGKVIGALGNKLTNLCIRLEKAAREARQKAEATQALSEVEEAYEEWFFERSQDPSPESYETLVSDAKQVQRSLLQHIEDKIEDPELRASASNSAIKYFRKKTAEARVKAREHAVGYTRALDDLVSAKAAKVLALQDSPERVQEGKQQFADHIRSQMELGVYSPEEAVKRTMSFNSSVDEARIIRRLRENPDIVLAELMNNELLNQSYPDLDAERRERLINQSIRYIEAKARQEDIERRQREREEERALKRAWAKNEGELWARVFSPNMEDVPSYQEIADMVEKQELNPDKADIYYKALQARAKDQGIDDPQIAERIERQVHLGEITDPSVIIGMVGNGLSMETARRLIGDMRNPIILSNPQYKEAVMWLEGVIGYNPIAGVGINPAVQAKAAEARRELRVLVTEGEDPWDAAIRIAPKYKKITSSMIPDTTYQTVEEVMQALSDGDISEREAEIEISRIKMKEAAKRRTEEAMQALEARKNEAQQ